MIKTIIQVADLHIPNAEQPRPYSKMLEQFLVELESVVKEYNKDEVRIVICGDVYVSKLKISNEAMMMFHMVLNKLNTIAKTYVIAGNHDMLENNNSRVDSIAPTFEIEDVYPNVIYLDKELGYKSGCLSDENITFALYSAHDRFARPFIEKSRKEYPNNTVIGLYHGDIPGSTTDIGYVSNVGISRDDFKGCDAVFCGHIHKFQDLKKDGIPIVYSSSVFQQNAGENTSEHGFVIWNMDDLSYTLHEVQNDYKIYKFKIYSYDDVKEDLEKPINL